MKVEQKSEREIRIMNKVPVTVMASRLVNVECADAITEMLNKMPTPENTKDAEAVLTYLVNCATYGHELG